MEQRIPPYRRWTTTGVLDAKLETPAEVVERDADAIRKELAAAKVEAVIPAKTNRANPAPHDRAKYRWRNRIERLSNKLKNWRRVATRDDKTPDSYIGFVSLASALLCLPFVHVA